MCATFCRCKICESSVPSMHRNKPNITYLYAPSNDQLKSTMGLMELRYMCRKMSVFNNISID